MQTSGMAPQFSDGVRKSVVGKKAPAPAKAPAAPKAPTPTMHRRGGFQKHAGKGKAC